MCINITVSSVINVSLFRILSDTTQPANNFIFWYIVSICRHLNYRYMLTSFFVEFSTFNYEFSTCARFILLYFVFMINNKHKIITYLIVVIVTRFGYYNKILALEWKRSMDVVNLYYLSSLFLDSSRTNQYVDTAANRHNTCLNLQIPRGRSRKKKRLFFPEFRFDIVCESPRDCKIYLNLSIIICRRCF